MTQTQKYGFKQRGGVGTRKVFKISLDQNRKIGVEDVTDTQSDTQPSADGKSFDEFYKCYTDNTTGCKMVIAVNVDGNKIEGFDIKPTTDSTNGIGVITSSPAASATNNNNNNNNSNVVGQSNTSNGIEEENKIKSSKGGKRKRRNTTRKNKRRT